jgi:hypothetical protein
LPASAPDGRSEARYILCAGLVYPANRRPS